ncbi:MAG: nuclear transport factor 2 family protein [Phycisphaerae bacterium]|nr:nuclear transport factor 2 family protein [Phycisphaerae bacterium]
MSNRELVERYLCGYNAKDVEAMLGLFVEEAVFESVSNTTGVIRTNGKEELRRMASMSVEYCEQRRQTPVAWVIDEAHVALEIDYWCRLAKDLPEGHRAGEEMRLRGASFFSIQEGRITRLVDYL